MKRLWLTLLLLTTGMLYAEEAGEALEVAHKEDQPVLSDKDIEEDNETVLTLVPEEAERSDVTIKPREEKKQQEPPVSGKPKNTEEAEEKDAAQDPSFADNETQTAEPKAAFAENQLMGYENPKQKYSFQYPSALVSAVVEGRKTPYVFRITSTKDKKILGNFRAREQFMEGLVIDYDEQYAQTSQLVAGQFHYLIIFESNKKLVTLRLQMHRDYKGADQSALILNTITQTLKHKLEEPKKKKEKK